VWNQQGVQGEPGVSGYEVIRESVTHTLVGDGGRLIVTATCPDGKNVLGGGYSHGATVFAVIPVAAGPTAGNDGWQVVFLNTSATNLGTVWTVSAICATVEP
jgi:hypothetical protein